MTNSNQPVLTPNVRIENTTARKIIGNTFGWATLGLLAVGVVDANLPAVDWSSFTVPATGIVAGLFSLYQLTITSPNVPKFK